tara:strand:- start:2426 stop:2908 length:483 start_codon:yes stop_codon:yes gene_type:complete
MRKELILVSFVFLAALLRLIPHPPNFAPVTALALFSGVYFNNKVLGVLSPIIAMLISDYFLGFYNISIWVYISFISVTLYGMFSQQYKFKNIILSSIIFFIISNFGVWLIGYPKSLEGLLTCYFLALPFFSYSILGDIFYSLILKHSFGYVNNKWLIKIS